MNLETLNKQFGLDDHIRFVEGNGGLTKAILRGENAAAEVYLHGAHVTSFIPKDGRELLWMSELSSFEADRPIRGGVPICWPWFGQPDPGKPQHGFARTSQWSVLEAKQNADESIELALSLTSSDDTMALWPHSFETTFRVIIDRHLTMQLTCLNTGEEPMTTESALHTYFRVDDIAGVRIDGLSGKDYIDKLDSKAVKSQSGSIVIDREVDRIYVDTDDTITIDDGAGSKIKVRKSGSRSTVIWNPWIDKSKAMADFPDDGYKTMLCVESTNADEDARTIEPGRSHTITQMAGVVQ